MLQSNNIRGVASAMFCIAAVVHCSGAGFLVPGTNHLERLEVEEGYAAERKVAVPLVRANADAVETNVLSASGVEHMVIWETGEKRKVIDVSIPYGLKADDEIPLALRGGGMQTASRIAVVAPVANSPTNPWWIGERRGEALGWGEWTMDIAAATGKVAATAGKAYTIIYFSGVLWCPWCQGLENGVFKTDAFKAWCITNRVSLVVLDNPRRSTIDHISGDRPYMVSDVPDGKPPTLLRYEGGKNNVIGKMVSGASYLSRKSIPLDAAEAKLQENHTLGYRGGAFAAPEAWRTSYPTLILLKKNGAVAGRLNYYAPTTTEFDANENMARLDDLIRLADGNGEADNYAATTTRSIKCGESTAKCRFQINDRTEVFEIENIPEGAVEFKITNNTADRPILLSVMRVSDDIQDEIASGTNAVTCTLNGDGEGHLFLKASAFGETVKYGANTAFRADIESTIIVRQDSESECSTMFYAGFNCKMPLSSNVCSIPSSGKVRMKILSGKMPSGVKFAYNAETGGAMFAGVAKKAGEYCVSCSFNGGDATELSFTVKDPAAENPNLSKAWSATLPLLHRSEVRPNEVAGTITLSAKANNSIAAKYICSATGKPISFKGRWDGITKGTATTELTAKSGERLILALASDGTISATMHDAHYESILESGVCMANTDYACKSFGGTYTVALPEAHDTAGAGYLTLSISADTGMVKWKGMLANGQTINGTSMLSTDLIGIGLVPVFKVTSKCTISALLALRPNAGAASSRRAVRLAEGTEAFWVANGTVHRCKAYGSWYAQPDSIADLCLESSLPTSLQLRIGPHLESVTATAMGFDLGSKESGLRLSCKKKDGVFKGAGRLEIGGRSVTVKYAGVIIPGWYDCGCELSDSGDKFPIELSLPFAIGSAYYTDRTDGITTRQNLAVKIGEPE